MRRPPLFRSRRRAALALLVVTPLLPLGCGIAQQAVGTLTPGGGTPAPAAGYASEKGGYALTCPAGWRKQPAMVGPIDMGFMCQGVPGVNISVTWAPTEPGHRELTKEIAEELKKAIRSNYPGYEITAEEWREVDGAKAFSMSARFTQFGVTLQNKQVMLVKDGKFYTLTYTASPDSFMQHLGDFEKVVSSFSVK